MSAAILEISQEDRNLTSAFDSSHDFLLGSRVGKAKAGDDAGAADKKKEGAVLKKAAAATILYDFLKNNGTVTAFPTTKPAAEKRVDDTKEFMKGKAGISAFNEDSYMQYVEKKYDIPIGLGGSKYGDYPTIKYEDLLTHNSKTPSEACKRALQSRILTMPTKDISEEENPVKLQTIKTFILKFFKLDGDVLNVAADGPIMNVFNTFLGKQTANVNFILNWANKFDPAGGISPNEKNVSVAPNIRTLSELPGSELSSWLATTINKLDSLKMNMETKAAAWNQEVKDAVKMRIGNELWYNVDPKKRSPGVPDISETFTLDENKAAGPPQNSAVESPKLLREKLTKIVKTTIPGPGKADTAVWKDYRRRFYIAYFMDLKEAGDRSQIYWVADFSTKENPIVFITNDRMCSLISRMNEKVDTCLATIHRLEMFKAYKKGVSDPALAVYQSIVEQLNKVNRVYGFSSEFAGLPYFQVLQEYLLRGRIDSGFNMDKTYSLPEIAALIPSIFVSLHAAERYKEISVFIEQIQTFLDSLELNKESITEALKSDIVTFRKTAKKLEYLQIGLYTELPPAVKTVEKLLEIHDTLKELVNDEAFAEFEELTHAMNLQVEYTGNTLVIGGQKPVEESRFWRNQDDLTKLQYTPAECSLFKFNESAPIAKGNIPCSVTDLQKELMDASSKSSRARKKAFDEFVKTLASYSAFFGKVKSGKAKTENKFLDKYNDILYNLTHPDDAENNLDTFVKSFVDLEHEYWKEAEPTAGGARTPTSPFLNSLSTSYSNNNSSPRSSISSPSSYGSDSMQMLATPVSITDLFKNARIVLSAFKAFQKSLVVRKQIGALLGASVVKLPTYEQDEWLSFGGTRKLKRNGRTGTRKQTRRRQRGGGTFDEPNFHTATYRYVSSLQTTLYDFSETRKEILTEEDRYVAIKSERALVADVMEQITDITNGYLNDMNKKLLAKYVATAPIESVKTFDALFTSICALSKLVFVIERCDRIVGWKKISYNAFFGSSFDAKLIDYIENFAIILGIDKGLPRGVIESNPEAALLLCMRSLQRSAEKYSEFLETQLPADAEAHEITEETAIVNTFYAESLAAIADKSANIRLSPDIGAAGGGRGKTRKMRRRF